MHRVDRVIAIIKDHVSPEVLREVYLELEKFDIEAKREILAYARKEEEKDLARYSRHLGVEF